MDDGGRRCALPGCDRPISTVDGRPERRYCTAAHRVAARQARRAAARAAQGSGPDPLAETLPWLREPAADEPTGLVDVPATEPDPPTRRTCDHRRVRFHRRVLAVLGVAGVLAVWYAATVPGPSPTPVGATPRSETTDAWATRATTALASVNRELDVLAQAEAEWRRLPEGRRVVVPPPVVALEERRSVLERRRAMLQSQLDAYRSLRRAQQELADSEQHLRAVEKALVETPPDRRDAATAALEEQRDLRLRRRDAQQAELASLADGVAAATRAPLPDDGEATEDVSREVREVVRTGRTEPTETAETADTAEPPPDAGREEQREAPEEPDPAEGADEPTDEGATPAPETLAAEPGESEGPGTSDAPAPPTDEPSQEQADDTMAELWERAQQVAREARRAEAARS